MPPTKDPKQRPAPQTARLEAQQRPHPSLGGTRGWDLSTRQLAVSVKLNGEEDSEVFQSLRQQRYHPSKSSSYRWTRKLTEEGNLLPYEMNRNNPATVLRGHPLFMLAVFRMLYPKATAAEQKTLFWNDQYPFGINGTSRATIIDWDEAAIFLESTNRGYGKCHLSRRVVEEGPYNHSEKYTLTAAIRGGAVGGCWIDVSLRAGTTVIDTHDFIDEIINGAGGIGQGGVVPATGVNNTHTFICDNLTSHKNPMIRTLIEGNHHRLLFRAPYYPCDGPIEYFFNHLQQQLTMELYNITDAAGLNQAINQICQRCQGQFDNYFAHCGYAP